MFQKLDSTAIKGNSGAKFMSCIVSVKASRNDLMSFALLDTQDHALAVDRWECESNGLGDAQARGIAGG